MATTPVPADIDINDILEQFALQGTMQQHQAERLDQAQATMDVSANAEVEAIRREGALTGQIQSAVDQILLARAERNKEAAAFFGVNQEANSSIIQEMAANILDQHRTLQENARGIQERQQRSFMDDPLAWITDQFALPADVQAHNTGVAIMKADVETLQKLGKLADEQIARNNAIDATTSVHLSHLAAEKAAAAAEIRVQDARQKAMQFGISLDSIRTANSQQAFANMLNVHQAGVSLQHLQLSRSTKTHNDAMRKLQEQNLQLLIDKKNEDAAARATLQGNLDRATSIIGMRKITLDEYERSPQQIKTALFDVMSNPNIYEGRLGYDTVDAIETAQILNAPLTPQTQEVKKIITGWTAVLSKDATFAALKPAEKHTRAQQEILNNLRREAAMIPDTGGLYSAPSLAAVGKIPAVTATKLWKEVFEPIAKVNPNTPTKSQDMFNAALNAAAAGRMSLQEASGELALIYRAITIDNTQQRDYNRFALPAQNEYRARIQSGAAAWPFSDSVVVDLANPTQVTNALLRGIVAKKQQETGIMRPLPPATGGERPQGFVPDPRDQ